MYLVGIGTYLVGNFILTNSVGIVGNVGGCTSKVLCLGVGIGLF